MPPSLRSHESTAGRAALAGDVRAAWRRQRHARSKKTMFILETNGKCGPRQSKSMIGAYDAVSYRCFCWDHFLLRPRHNTGGRTCARNMRQQANGCFAVALVAAAAVVASAGGAVAAEVLAGAAKVDLDPPIGVPLAGYSERQWKFWPLPKLRHANDPYTTWMQPSTSKRDPVFAKALVLEVDGVRTAHVSVDAIGSDGGLLRNAFLDARARGYRVSFENTLFHGSHSHSSMGGVSTELLWEIAPATDMVVPKLQEYLASRIADAMVQADQAVQPAVLGMGMGMLYNATRNRRAGLSPYVTPESIDPHLGVIRVDTPDGKPLATVWNFAIHGTCLPGNSYAISADIMGATNAALESALGGVALFINSDAGDVAPHCGDNLSAHANIAAAVQAVRARLRTTTDVSVTLASQVIPFGPTNLNLTLERVGMCPKSAPTAAAASPAAALLAAPQERGAGMTLRGAVAAASSTVRTALSAGINLCTVFKHLSLNVHLGDGWVECNPRFSSLIMSVAGERFLLVSAPGEPLTQLGREVRSDAEALGFPADHTFIMGYTNNHMGYFTTPNEYDVGGYESMLSFWGRDTGERIRAGCRSVMTQVVQQAAAAAQRG